MERTDEAVIVSAFGRGHWLAGELAARGWRVSLVDVSETMGHWEPEDWEGPFGVLHSDHLRPSQLQRLADEDELIPVANGFTIWLPEGPIEFRGPMSRFLFEKRGVGTEAEDYLLRFNIGHPELLVNERRLLQKLGFSKSWLAHFAHQFGANVFQENAKGLCSGVPLRLFSPYSIRRVTRQGYQKSLKQCRERGAWIHHRARIQDLRFNGRQLEALEIASERSGILRSKLFVWMLSSEESLKFPKAVHESLFPRGPIQPTWMWMRFRLRLKPGVETDTLPLQFAIIGNINLPWTHSNLIQVQRTVDPQLVDAWIRIPYQQRFQKDYLQRMAAEILEEFGRRMPATESAIEKMPLEFESSGAQIGAPRFPVYEGSDLEDLATLKVKNVFFDGPEHWPSLDWVGQMVHQGELINRLEAIKAEWESVRVKEVEL